MYSFTIEKSDEGTRLDAFLAANIPEISRSRVQRLLEQGAVLIGKENVPHKNYRLRGGETISVCVPEPRELEILPEDIPLAIVYEDHDILVIDKPKGMVVHPAPGNENGTLVNAILYHCHENLSSIGGAIRPGIVHRIDKDTSGLLAVAKNDRAHQILSAQLAAHEMKREYRAIAYNNFKDDEGVVDMPIGRDPQNRQRQAVAAPNARNAVTRYRVLERFGNFTYIALRLETGRTHQIRVHMAYIKHPLLGDPLYGPKKKYMGIETQMLHARLLGFKRPSDGAYVEFESALPPEFESVLARLR